MKEKIYKSEKQEMSEILAENKKLKSALEKISKGIESNPAIARKIATEILSTL